MKQPTGPAFIFEATRYHNLIKTDHIVLWMILSCMEPNRLWSLRRISHVISKISSLLCCLKVRKTDLVERFYPWEKDCPAHIMNQIRCDILIPESWYPSQQALCDSKWILVAKNRRAVVGGRRQNQYNCQCWSIRSVVRQGSGSGLFRSQQFNTDPNLLSMSHSNQDSRARSTEPTQISSAKIEIHQGRNDGPTAHVFIDGHLIDFYKFLSQT